MFLSFFYSFFFVTGAGQFVAAALNLSQGIPAGFFSSFSFFFLSLDLGPDAKSNTDLNSAPPPLDPPLDPDSPLVFTQGVVPGAAPKRSTFNAI